MLQHLNYIFLNIIYNNYEQFQPINNQHIVKPKTRPKWFASPDTQNEDDHAKCFPRRRRVQMYNIYRKISYIHSCRICASADNTFTSFHHQEPEPAERNTTPPHHSTRPDQQDALPTWPFARLLFKMRNTTGQKRGKRAMLALLGLDLSREAHCLDHSICIYIYVCDIQIFRARIAMYI